MNKSTLERATEILDEERGNGYRLAFEAALSRAVVLGAWMAGDKGLTRRDTWLLNNLFKQMASDVKAAEIPYPVKMELQEKVQSELADMLARVGRRS